LIFEQNSVHTEIPVPALLKPGMNLGVETFHETSLQGF